MKLLFPKDKITIIKWAAFGVFLGRAYQHLFWDAPYREIIWDPHYTAWLVRLFSDLTWDEFVTHQSGDILIQRFVVAMGVLFLSCAIISLLVNKIHGLLSKVVLVLGGLGLIVLALIYAKDKFFHIGQFFEYSLQFGAPFFLLFYHKFNGDGKTIILWGKIATAVAFVCHGLYALGFYPYPGTFMTMTHNILGLGPEGTIQFLNLAGIIDFIVAVGIFLPNRWGRMALAYCVFWGFMTCIARIFGNFYWEYPLESLHQWVFEAVYRVPHFLIPLWILQLELTKE